MNDFENAKAIKDLSEKAPITAYTLKHWQEYYKDHPEEYNKENIDDKKDSV